MTDPAARAAELICQLLGINDDETREKVENLIREECPTEETLRATVESLNESYSAALDKRNEVQKENERLREALENYGEHTNECVLSYWEATDPTRADGYRYKYKRRWYREKPGCGCGLSAALAETEKRDV